MYDSVMFISKTKERNMNNTRTHFALLFLIASIFFNITADSGALSENPLLAVIIMVKNEEQVMLPTLQPYLDAKIDHFLILDTGSTDNTVATTRQIFADYGVKHGYVEEQPFIDFATSRNHAIALAEEKFPDIPFFLMIDAEWYIQNFDQLLQFCADHVNYPDFVFLINLRSGGSQNATGRLFRPHCGIKFVGAVHECLNRVGFTQAPKDVYFVWAPTRFGMDKTQSRWYRDRDILLKEYDKNPNDPRTTFYLAQTYACLGDWENAAYWYTIRSEQPGWDQENYMAYYKLADAYEHLENWPKALWNYLKAYSLRPQRAEPLVRLAQHYLAVRDFTTAFLFAHQAVRIPVFETENLFFDKIMYDFVRYDLLGIASWYVGEFEVGEQAVRKAMEYWPDAAHLKFNLGLYLDRKNK